MADPTKTPSGAYTPDGKSISQADLPGAIAAGTARWRADATVPFVAPDGTGWDISGKDAWAQIQKGWRPISQHEQAVAIAKRTAPSVSQVLGAGAAGFAEALPGGRLLTDQFINEDEREVLEAAAPFAGGVGTAAGLVAPMVVSGGVSGALKAGQLGRAGLAAATAPARVVSGAATRVGGAAAGLAGKRLAPYVESAVASGLEGATYAAGNELARQARGDANFNAEAFASAIGEGALFGAGAGAATRAVGRGIKYGTKATADKLYGLNRALSQADEAANVPGAVRLTESEAWTLKSAGLTPGQARNIDPARAKIAAREMLDSGIIAREGPVAAFADDLVTKSGKLKAAFDDLGQVQIPKVYTEVDDLMGKMPSLHRDATVLEAAAPAGALERKKTLLQPLVERVAALRNKGGGSVYARVGDKIKRDWLVPLQKARTLTEIHGIEQDIRQLADKLDTKSLGGSELTLLRGELKTAVRKVIDEVSPDHGAKLRKLDETYAAFAPFIDPVSKAAMASQTKKADLLTPYEAGILAGGSVIQGGFGIGAAIAGVHAGVRHLRASDRFAAFMARATDEASAVGAKQRVTISGAIAKAAEKVPLKITAGAPGRVAALTKQFHERSEPAKQAVARPQQALMRLADVLAPVARTSPEDARLLANIYADDMAWLAAQVPKGWSGDVPLDNALRATVSRSQLVPPSAAAKFVRTAKTLADPVEQIKQIGEGKLPDPETADVLLERRPHLRARVESEFDAHVLRLAESGKQMSYEARLQATLLTGKAYDSTMTPEAINFFQDQWGKRWQATAAAQPAAGGGDGSRRGRVTREARKRTSMYQTTAESTMEQGEL